MLNEDGKVTGILLQMPLPKHLNESYLLSLIDTNKDVDGFTTENIGKLVLGQACNVACTPKGIITLLKHYNIQIEGKDVLIINRSNIVGKPLAHLLLNENATVTIAHSKTKDLDKKIKSADIVISAIGKPEAFTKESFSKYTTIIDVSMNRDSDGKLCGDIKKSDYEEIIKNKCSITPVPGGVGQMTVISLIEQVIDIQENKNRL